MPYVDNEEDMTPEEAMQELGQRANTLLRHGGDTTYMAQHRDQTRALLFLEALDGKEYAVDGIKKALQSGENRMLVKLYATRDTDTSSTDVLGDPALYSTLLCIYAIADIDHERDPEVRYPDIAAMTALIEQYYEPVDFAPFTRQQLVDANREG